MFPEFHVHRPAEIAEPGVFFVCISGVHHIRSVFNAGKKLAYFIGGRLSVIVQNHDEKIRRRMGGFLDWSGAEAPTLRAMLRSVA